MKHVAHCRPDTGEIVQVSLCQSAFELDGLVAVEVPAAAMSDPGAFFFDGERVRARTEEELAAYRRPTMLEVKALRYTELLKSDLTQVPDYPLPAEVKAQWAAYRDALRALGDYSDPADWLTKWPERPDGVDIAKPLRDRL